MFLRLRLFGAEVLSLTLADDDPDGEAPEDKREVDMGVVDATIAEDKPLGFGLPRTRHDEPADRR